MTATQSNAASASYGNTFSVSATDKWGGMIEQSLYKRTRTSLFHLTSYIYNECPPMFIMHHIVSVFRLLQYIGPALFVPFRNIWIEETKTMAIMNFLSVFFHIFPVSIRNLCTIPFLIFYSVILVLFYIFICSSAFYYKRNAKLPVWISRFIYIFLNTFGYLLHTITFQLSGELYGKLFYVPKNEDSFKYNILFGVVLLVYFAYLWLQLTVSSTSILFNPSSLMTVLAQPQVIISFLINITTYLLAIASQCTRMPMYTLIIVSCILYVISGFVPFVYGGFVYVVHQNIVLTCAISGSFFCVAAIIIDATNRKGSEIVVFLIIAVLIIAYLISMFITNSRRKKALIILDLIEEDRNNMDLIKTPNRFEEIAIVGLSVAHPICISWTIFQYAVEKWPQNVNIWVLYAKFVVIYPEESQKLGWIQQQLIALHVEGATSKHIQEEIITISRMRESNLSPELKKKLNHINKKVQLVKHKLRHIWDLIIQGNISDMGSFIEKTYDAVMESQADYNHLIRVYPNSRFITRSYARFLLEIMADHEGYSEWNEKSQAIRRGISVTVDHAHELGLTYFPYLPLTTNISHEAGNVPTVFDSESQYLEMEEGEEKSQIVLEQSIAMRQQIDEVRIPGISNTIIQRIIIVFVFFFIAVGATLIVFDIYRRYSEPLIYLHYSSVLRTYIFLSTSYGLHYVQEKTGLVLPRQEYIDDNEEPPPKFIGNTWDLSLQFSYIINKLTDSVKKLGGLRTIAQNNKNMIKARELIFGHSVNYTYITEDKISYRKQISVTVASMDVVTQLSNLLSTKNVTKDIYNTSMIINPTVNANKIAEATSEALGYITNFMDQNYTMIKRMSRILNTFFIIFGPIIMLIILILEIKNINDNKNVIYKCLTLIPKNVVSSVADSLKVVNADPSECSVNADEDSEMNKQEENMFKLFATASDSSTSKIGNNILMIAATFISVILIVILVLEVNDTFINMSTSIYEAAPNINNLMGAYAYQCSMLMMMSIIGSENEGYKISSLNTTQIIPSISDSLQESLNYFHIARFGSTDGSRSAFEQFNTGVLAQDDEYRCNSNMTYEKPKTIRDAYKCISLELLYYVVESFINILVKPMEEKGEVFSPSDEIMRNIWEIETVFMYNRLFYPISSEIISSVKEAILKVIKSNLTACYLVSIGEIIVELFVIYSCILNKYRMNFAMKLLLHCQPSVVMQVPLITNVLGGNFKLPKGDSSGRTKEFFDEVLNHFPDSLFIVDEMGTIISVSLQGKRMFEQFGDLVGMKMNDFMNFPAFENTMKNIKKQPPQEENITFINASNDKFNLNIKSHAFNQMVAFLISDITQTVRYNKLIDEERGKSDKLLESILPAKLVKRVQLGEKNISFSVQSASIIFMDIVSFTPWCGSLPSNRVVEILNILYKEFDALVSKFTTITKIKCIGDCYMAASGIFSEINQPAVHAKEMVEFGLESISAVGRVNAETSQTLQIRVGINTGGPLVAGVLGCGKPTFEIFGPAINMAQQMEHNGVPMQVHISRAVYELIYGGEFIVKERGQIELKNGPAITYLVSP